MRPTTDASRTYAWIVVIYLSTRLALYVCGVRFSVSYAWQHFHDLDLLQHRLWESLLYTHSFSPFMNLLVGATLKVFSPQAAAVLYQGLFLVLGLSFSLAFAYLLDCLGISRRVTLVLTSLFICSPPFLYFESFFHYEFPTAALLALSAVLFHRALVSERFFAWLAFFFVCALLTFVRLTFHLVWIVAVAVLAVLAQRRRWRLIVTAALLPVLLVVALYAKNLALFGFFGASSRTGFTVALVTVRQLSKAERKALVAAREIHPASLLSVYAGADEFAPYVTPRPPTGIAVLDRVRRENGEVNYNHVTLIEAAQLQLRDGRHVMQRFPFRYVRTVLRGIEDYFRPSTRWHPRDPEGSPHQNIRDVLEPWENAYHALVHRFPVSPFGLYLLLCPLALYGVWLALRSLWQARYEGSEREKLVLFMAFNAAFVPALSCLVAIGELERYRFIVEGFVWLIAAFSVSTWALRARAGRTNDEGPAS